MARYTVPASRVAASLKVLREQYIHPHFAAYLALKRASATFGREVDLPLDYDEFWETYLKVGKANPRKPYLRPFLDERPSDANRLLNRNVAGSYSFSSFRRTLLQVVDSVERTEGRRKTHLYSFKPHHCKLARIHLLKGLQVPISDLVIVMYRDYALDTDATDPSLDEWITVFRQEFGYEPNETSHVNEEFDHLFSDDNVQRRGEEWLQMTE